MKKYQIDRTKGYPRFVIRKVHNGHIKFDHQLWIPDEPTDRLNGMRFAFGVYVEGSYSHPIKRLDMLGLWGSEKTYENCTYTEYGDDDYKLYSKLADQDDKLLAPDGYFRQYWWHPVDSDIEL